MRALRLFLSRLRPFRLAKTGRRAQMVVNDDNDAVGRSRDFTGRFRSEIFVGASRESHEQALRNAWELAKAEAAAGQTTLAPRMEARIVEQWAVAENPFTDFFVAIRLAPTP
jgi:hypothetical protein